MKANRVSQTTTLSQLQTDQNYKQYSNIPKNLYLYNRGVSKNHISKRIEASEVKIHPASALKTRSEVLALKMFKNTGYSLANTVYRTV
jgi:hypothetical protein